MTKVWDYVGTHSYYTPTGRREWAFYRVDKDGCVEDEVYPFNPDRSLPLVQFDNEDGYYG